MSTGEAQAFLTVASRFENIELIQSVVNELLVQLELAEDTRHWVALAVREAMANAIKHGNESDPDRRVTVLVGVDNGEVVIRVRDRGRGFDLESIGDPLAPENILKPGGRGLFYMKSLMDSVEYRFDSQEGTEVTLRKQVISEEAAEA